MTNVIDFKAFLQKKRAAQSAQLEHPFSEHDIDQLYDLIQSAAEWFHTDDGNDFWIDEMYISQTIELCSMMIKRGDEPTEEVLTSLLGYIRFLTDFMSNCVADPAKFHEMILEIAKAFEPCSPIDSDSHKQSFRVALLALMQARRWSVNELARHLNQSEGWVRSAITQLRRMGHKIVNYPADHTFGFEEGIAPPLGPVGGGDGRWKRLA